MKVLISIVILAGLIEFSPAVPVADKGVTYPVPWQTIKQLAVDYNKLTDIGFDFFRVLCMNSGPSGILLSENIIQSHVRTNRVLNQVHDKIEQRSLNCVDVQHFSEEVLDIFIDVLKTLLETIENEEIKAKIRALFAGTVLDSSRIVSQVMSLLGC